MGAAENQGEERREVVRSLLQGCGSFHKGPGDAQEHSTSAGDSHKISLCFIVGPGIRWYRCKPVVTGFNV